MKMLAALFALLWFFPNQVELPAIEVSLDGETWGTSVEGPLWPDDDQLWVPGDSATSWVWVRNNAATPGEITVSILETTETGLFESGEFAAAIIDSELSEQSVVNSNGVVSQTLINPGETKRILVEVEFVDSAATNQSQEKSYEFTLLVTGTEKLPPGDVGEEPPGDDDANGEGNGLELPKTGALVSVWLAALGLASLGVVLVVRRGRRT